LCSRVYIYRLTRRLEWIWEKLLFTTAILETGGAGRDLSDFINSILLTIIEKYAILLL